MNHYIIHEEPESDHFEKGWKTVQKDFESIVAAWEFMRGPEVERCKAYGKFAAGPFVDSHTDSPVAADMFNQVGAEHYEVFHVDGIEDMNKYLESKYPEGFYKAPNDLQKKHDDLLGERFIDEGIVEKESSEKCGSPFKEQMKYLERGDIVKHVNNSQTFVVTGNYGGRVTAVATVDITNPAEWELVLKARDEKSEEAERRQEFMDHLRDQIQDRKLDDWLDGREEIRG